MYAPPATESVTYWAQLVAACPELAEVAGQSAATSPELEAPALEPEPPELAPEFEPEVAPEFPALEPEVAPEFPALEPDELVASSTRVAAASITVKASEPVLSETATASSEPASTELGPGSNASRLNRSEH